ncbi:uncharacterized protein BO88DRAFT_471767 [Aspergillus vadensis CBS 113365]|uniref:Rhodopsin domain-containing protein n=1 Tax=Aspergillus vadensis (strain CBS 113365 / IMI 142717 / IBT 24658) TaxID=1448311 RepID=A0A319BGB7_ASPVC|nr:hypothetical protein BO88DRAFT_471767 [Aspergillus vadensis CBS 113365]PYH64913.1 hypothetical protein BO88DRAFT_471767 [Aspergillus vadensis CBS 113365]
MTTCVTAKCTGREQLQSRQCGIPVHKGRPAVEAATIVPLVISTLLFLNRILAKIMGLGGGWGADDVTITIAWALAVGIFGVNVKMIELGFGKNMWDIIPMDNITLIFKCFQGFVVMYKTQVSLAKISVCLFLLRIFQSNLFRYTTWAVIGLNAAIGITWVLTDSFRCIPVHLAWTQWEGLETGRCVDFIAVTFANAFVNIAVDIIMVLMPVYEVTKLNLSARKKLGVSVMFAMGLVLTAVAIIRVVVFWYNRWNTNLTEQLQPIVHWSVLETQIAVMCACLPTFRAMLVHLFPKVLGNTSDHSTYGKRNTPSGGAAFGSQQPLSKSHINKTVSYSVDYGGKKKPQRSSFVQLVELDPQAHP